MTATKRKHVEGVLTTPRLDAARQPQQGAAANERKRLSSTVVQVVDGGDPRRYRMGSTRAVDGSDSATFHGSSSSMRLAGWSAMRSST